MRIILLERVPKLGLIGDIVNVKPGFARNFLIPQNKAAPATPQHIKIFEAQRAQIEAHNLETKNEASKIYEKLKDVKPIIITKASEAGHLYGSVKPRDIAQALADEGVTVSHKQIHITPIKTIGVHTVSVRLHPEVSAGVSLCVATNEEEAENLRKEVNKAQKKTKDKKAKAAAPQEEPVQATPEDENLAREEAPDVDDSAPSSPEDSTPSEEETTSS